MRRWHFTKGAPQVSAWILRERFEPASPGFKSIPKRGNAWTVVSGAIDWTDFPMALSTQCFQPRSLLLR